MASGQSKGIVVVTTPYARWRYTPEELTSAVATSHSYRQILGKLGMSQQGGGSYETLQRRISLLGLDVSHLTGKRWNRDGRFNPGACRTRPLAELLVADSPVTSFSRLKKRILSSGLLETSCQICGLEPEWQGKPLVLRLDHVNGVKRDNRLENLRLVCPNCDSQLPTFAGRNRRPRNTRR